MIIERFKFVYLITAMGPRKETTFLFAHPRLELPTEEIKNHCRKLVGDLIQYESFLIEGWERQQLMDPLRVPKMKLISISELQELLTA